MLVQRATLGELLLKGSQARPYYNQVKDAQDRTIACYGDLLGLVRPEEERRIHREHAHWYAES